MPRSLARARPHVGERPPKKYQDRRRNSQTLRSPGIENAQQSAQDQIKQDVVELSSNAKPGSLSTFNQLSKPGIINVARKIPSLNARLPKARYQNQNRRTDATKSGH